MMLVLLQAPPDQLDLPHRGQGASIFHRCDDALSFYHEVRARGIHGAEPYVGNRLWMAEFRDPDGYRLSFGSPTEAPEGLKLSDRRPDPT